eukprot:2975974-Rhodomonas_salina.1
MSSTAIDYPATRSLHHVRHMALMSETMLCYQAAVPLYQKTLKANVTQRPTGDQILESPFFDTQLVWINRELSELALKDAPQKEVSDPIPAYAEAQMSACACCAGVVALCCCAGTPGLTSRIYLGGVRRSRSARCWQAFFLKLAESMDQLPDLHLRYKVHRTR